MCNSFWACKDVNRFFYGYQQLQENDFDVNRVEETREWKCECSR